MYNVHLYQKWGVRKGKQESNKEKKKKRRREPTEEAESVASSSHTASDHPVEEQSGHHASDLNQISGSLESMPRDVLEYQHQQQMLEIQHLRFYQPPTLKAPLRAQPPGEWNEFLQHSPAFRVDSSYNGGTNTTGAMVLRGEQQGMPSHANYHDQHYYGDGDSWMSTVLVSEAPSSVSYAASSSGSHGSGTSGRTRTSNASSRSRLSGASSSRETLLSSNSSRTRSSLSKRKSAKSQTPTMELPHGTLRLLDAPDGLLFAERSLFYARHYISSTFSTGLWTLSQSTDTSLLDTECVKLDRWYNNFGPGLDLLHAGKINQAFEIFMKCFAGIEDIITPQDPRVVIYICQQAIRLMWYDQQGRKLSQTLLKYVSGLCRKLFNTRHPLFIIMDQMSRMSNFEFAKAIPTMMECYFDHLEPFLDHSSTAFRFVNDLRGLTVSIMEGTGMLGMYEAMPVLERLVKRAQERGHASLHIQLEMAAMLMRSRFFDETIALLTELRESEEAKNDAYEFAYSSIILMLTYRRMKDSDSVIRVGYEMVDWLSSPEIMTGGEKEDFSSELWRANYRSGAAIIIGKLELELRELNRIAEADEVKARLDVLMDEEFGINAERQPAGDDIQDEMSSLAN